MTILSIYKYSLSFLFLFLSMICFGQSKIFTAPHNDTVKVVRIDLATLIQNSKNYNGMWVETRGSVLVLFEMFAVAPEENTEYKVDGIKALWLDIDKKMKVDIQFLNGKNWVIKGKVNANNRGHMNQYQGTIEDIYFLKQY